MVMVEAPATVLNDRSSAVHEQALMDLSVTLAHRIRSLVASIEGFTDLLTDSLATSEQREMALRILEGAARIERVLADLQLYSKPVEPVPVPVRIHDVVVELLRFLDETESERVKVEFRMDVDLAVLVDPTLFNQAMLILIRNAFEATNPQSTIRLTIEQAADRRVCFEVWNEGGIDVEDASVRVFTPFYTTKAQNLGIGLPVARRIAEAHGGSLVLVSSSFEAGTRFALHLPIHDGPFASILDL